ncbi:MAG: glycoside hydrolase family 99-like domain-containing protein [Desulfuromonadales bacterium]|nr:glycoside hydrolase family 99-like domain-containing protein [Desulfuromonadales bacterium]
MELGTHTGNSYFAFCQAVRAAGLSTRCFAVDTWEGDSQAGYYGNEIYVDVSDYNARHYADFSQLLRLPFDQAVTHFDDGSIDFLHIDGLHTYQAVRHDFESWLPKLSSRALVLFHDTAVHRDDFGVWRLWQELSCRYPHLHFEHCNGLGVLAIGKDLPANIQALFHAWTFPEQRVRFAQLFDRLGLALMLQIRLHEWQLEARNLQQIAENLKQAEQIASTRLAERDHQLLELTSTHDREMAELLATHEGRLSDLVASHDREMAELLATHERQSAQYDRHLAEQLRHIETLRHRIDALLTSRSWRLTAPLRYLTTNGRVTGQRLLWFRQQIHARGGWLSVAVKTHALWRREGLAGLRQRMRRLQQGNLQPQLTPTAQESNDSATIQRDAAPASRPYYLDPAATVTIAPYLRIAVHLHLYYPQMLDEFTSRLQAMPVDFDLYVSVRQNSDTTVLTEQLRRQLPRLGQLVIEAVPNRGRDIAPFIVQFGQRLLQYDLIAHFHSKQSPHSAELSHWCADILNLLLGTAETAAATQSQILHLLQQDAKLVYPEGQRQILKDRSGWGANQSIAEELLRRYTDVSIADYPVVEFPEGAMFWARAEALRPFLTLPLNWQDFPAEPIPADGTLAHALERLILILANRTPGRFYRLHRGDSIADYRYYEPQQDFSAQICDDIRVLSYYLPQFHPIPENDDWHGKGFTEWTKVRAANPLFVGHYQQHIPHHDLGYYRLDSPAPLMRQAHMMQKAGIHGQVFYHYWFTGKLILEQPARLLLENPDIPMPFCFCWANENWTRRWDGNEDAVLLQQNYSAADAEAFIHYLLPFFRDSRYVRIDNRPLLFVYRPASLPDPQQYLAVWSQQCQAAGLEPPYVVAVLTRGANDPRTFGMDAGVERTLHDWTGGAVPDIRDQLQPYQPLHGSVLDYDQVASFYAEQQQAKPYTWFRSLVPIWDNSARYGAEALLVHGSTPASFSHWLERLINYSRANLPADRRFILVNAWNEWAEGAHLEPDSRYGYAYLNAVGRTLAGLPYGIDRTIRCKLLPDTVVRIDLLPDVWSSLQADTRLHDRFVAALTQSSLFDLCRISFAQPELEAAVQAARAIRQSPQAARKTSPPESAPDYLFQFRRLALVLPDTLENMLYTAMHLPGQILLSNAYDPFGSLPQPTENGSVDSATAEQAPLLLFPVAAAPCDYKNYRLRTDAHSFVTRPDSRPVAELPQVTTILRFHRQGDLALLQQALYSLAAMHDCQVIPLLAVQDLSPEQTQSLEVLVAELPWPAGRQARILHFYSDNGQGDLRARMLNQALQSVTTRYAAFLDYDDRLFCHAYAWLLDRLRQTGKAVTFGRVYSTSFDPNTGQLTGRKREFTHGRCYEDFIACNPAPLHSFLLDLDQLDLSRLVWHDDQCYLEDYYLTLQLITRDNTDWHSLELDHYIGDYLHGTAGGNTLAVDSSANRADIISSPLYRECQERIDQLRVQRVAVSFR